MAAFIKPLRHAITIFMLFVSKSSIFTLHISSFPCGHALHSSSPNSFQRYTRVHAPSNPRVICILHVRAIQYPGCLPLMEMKGLSQSSPSASICINETMQFAIHALNLLQMQCTNAPTKLPLHFKYAYTFYDDKVTVIFAFYE